MKLYIYIYEKENPQGNNIWNAMCVNMINIPEYLDKYFAIINIYEIVLYYCTMV